MRKIRGNDKALAWTQPAIARRKFELRSGADIVGTLEWEKPLGTLATATTADATWTFKRTGVFHTVITVRRPGSDSDLASFTPAEGYGGKLQIDGSEYRWKSGDFWGQEWAFLGPEGAALVKFRQFQRPGKLFAPEAEIEVRQEASSCPDLPLLLALGWYVMILASDDSASIVAMTAAIL